MCNQTLSTITYNRKSQKYEASNGSGIYALFPNGPEGKQAAIQAIIHHDDPQIYAAAHHLHHDLFEHRPDLHPRIWKAARIASANHVFAPHILETAPNQLAYVTSQREENKYYSLMVFKGIHECDCFDYMHGNPPKVEKQPLCKHILAYKLMKIINRDLPEFTASPHLVIKHLECTGASFRVIGAVNGRFHPYTSPQTRKACPGEIIEQNNKQFRVTHNHNRQRLILIPFSTEAAPDPYETARQATGLPGHIKIHNKERELRERLKCHMDQAEFEMKRTAAIEHANTDLFN